MWIQTVLQINTTLINWNCGVGASRVRVCFGRNNGFSFHSSSKASFLPGPQSHKTGKRCDRSYPKKRFSNCGMWEQLHMLANYQQMEKESFFLFLM